MLTTRFPSSLLLASCLVLLGSACKINVNEEPTPEEKCDSLLDLICDRLEECTEDTGTQLSSSWHSTCITELSTNLDCDRAVDVDPAYDDCVDLVEIRSCTDLFGSSGNDLVLPVTCRGAIKVE